MMASDRKVQVRPKPLTVEEIGCVIGDALESAGCLNRESPRFAAVVCPAICEHVAKRDREQFPGPSCEPPAEHVDEEKSDDIPEYLDVLHMKPDVDGDIPIVYPEPAVPNGVNTEALNHLRTRVVFLHRELVAMRDTALRFRNECHELQEKLSLKDRIHKQELEKAKSEKKLDVDKRDLPAYTIEANRIACENRWSVANDDRSFIVRDSLGHVIFHAMECDRWEDAVYRAREAMIGKSIGV